MIVFPFLKVAANRDDWEEEEEGKLQSFATPSLGSFEGVKGNALYAAVVKIKSIRALREVKEQKWQGNLRGQSMAGFRWRVLYKLPLPKRSGDLQWRVIHGALVTNTFLSRLDSKVREGCPFCSASETVVHVFVDCNSLSAVCALLNVLCGKVGYMALKNK